MPHALDTYAPMPYDTCVGGSRTSEAAENALEVLFSYDNITIVLYVHKDS
jgi:hypothetical protein